MDDPTSLQNLRDIAEPAPVPWWPPAVGWWILFVIVAAAVIWIALRAWRRWQANAYRRAALEELRSATNQVEIAKILKRVALCAFPRTDVASLTRRGLVRLAPSNGWPGVTGPGRRDPEARRLRRNA